MFRLTDSLARDIMQKIRKPKVIEYGNDAFTYLDQNSIGLIDPHCAIGTDFYFSIECPVPIIYPEIQCTKPSVDGFFLYSREELGKLDEPWIIDKIILDPLCQDSNEQIDTSDCAITLANDIDKLTAKTLSSMKQLIKHVPTIVDCLNLDK